MELVTSPHPVQAKPKYSLTPLALLVTLMPGREAGSLGQRPQRPYGWTRFGRGLLIDDREVRGPPEMWWHRACLANSETLVSLLPQSTKGPGVPICQLVQPGRSSLRGETLRCRLSRAHKHTSMCSYVYALVGANKRSLREAYTHVHIPESSSGVGVQCKALQPRGAAPASSPARAGEEEHLAPQKYHPYPGPAHTHCITRGQGGFTHFSHFLPCQVTPRVTERQRAERTVEAPHLEEDATSFRLSFHYSDTLKGTFFRVNQFK